MQRMYLDSHDSLGRFIQDVKMEEGSLCSFGNVWSNPSSISVLNVWDANINALRHPPSQL